MPLFSKTIHAFGLDISDSSVKVMLLRRRGRVVRPAAFNAVIFPRGIVTKDVIREPQKLAAIIRRAIDEAKPHGFSLPYVIASLPESRSFIRLFDLPPMSERELPAAVKWEAEQHIPMSIEQVELDWKALNTAAPAAHSFFRPKAAEHGWKIFLTAAPKDVVHPVVDVLKLAKLQPVALESESIAIARSCISPSLEKQTVMFVDIGTNRTGVTIVNNRTINFTSSLSLAGLDLSQNIMSRTGLTFNEAERAKIADGLDPAKQKPDIRTALEEILEAIVKEIKNTMLYYSEHSTLPDHSVDHLMLSGGTARLQGIVSFFTKHFEQPIHLANPWVNIYSADGRELPPISSSDSLSFAAVIGLAQRGLDFTV